LVELRDAGADGRLCTVVHAEVIPVACLAGAGR